MPLDLNNLVLLQYYQVPRLWLVGYDESRQPLTPKQVRGLLGPQLLQAIA